RRRLAFDELFLIQAFGQQQKILWQSENAPLVSFDQKLIKSFVASLPFTLTDGQRKAAWEILQDLAKPRPMNRLLEGDVGSGKTIVALIAALQCANAGWQIAFMAPTEILAQQHFKEVALRLKNYPLKIALLTNSTSSLAEEGQTASVAKKQILTAIKTGQIKIVIGTHALIQKSVCFKNLALAVVDEQHRFGVQQRAALQKNTLDLCDGLPHSVPHLLSMTATPIPRTLALAIYGDLDLSLLKELPRGRQKIITKIIPPDERKTDYEFIRQEIKKGRQAFVICPRIEIANNHKLNTPGPNENYLSEIHDPFASLNEVKAVKQEVEKLTIKIFPEFKITALHGKLKPAEKNKTMADFKAGEINILVSTSVVEVGIDIQNATVMMIEGAERFGLAQLHQFRGRVGRGEHQSFCLLLTDSSSAKTNQRLKALLTAKSGFELAEKDLALRGPGEFYGSNQWGLPDLSMASLSDVGLLKEVRQEAIKLFKTDPELKNNPRLKERLRDFQVLIHPE
ncbi:MAG: ATP-dependent DNA helicase RecG, partial [Patescibacteria group bacterium]